MEFSTDIQGISVNIIVNEFDVMVFFEMNRFLLIISLAMQASNVNGITSLLPIDEYSHKYIVQVYLGEYLQCTGIIVAPTNILTSNECVNRIKSFNRLNNVKVHTLNTFISNVKHVYHFEPFIDKETDEWPLIGMIKVEGNIVNNAATASILFADSKYNDKCHIVGWRKNGTQIPLLTYSFITILNNEKCIQLDISITNERKCAHVNQGELEHYDYGAPIICENDVIGLVSEKKSIDPAIFSFFVINPYEKFVKSFGQGNQRDAEPGEFPNVVAVISNTNDFVQTGIIISSHKIIVSGRCCQTYAHHQLRVIVGETQIFEADFRNREGRRVRLCEIHPYFIEIYSDNTKSYYLNNVGLLTLFDEESLEETRYVGILPLSAMFPYPGRICQLVRWDRREINNLRYVLEIVIGEIVSADNCGDNRHFIHNFCVRNEHGQTLSHENHTGAPIICQGVVYGIFSEINHGNQPTLDVFTSASSGRSWSFDSLDSDIDMETEEEDPYDSF